MKKWIDKISRLPSYWQLKWSSFGTSRRETGPRIKLCTGSIDFFLKNIFQHIHDSQIPLNPDSSIQWWGFWMEWKKRKEKLPMIDRPESADNISKRLSDKYNKKLGFFLLTAMGKDMVASNFISDSGISPREMRLWISKFGILPCYGPDFGLGRACSRSTCQFRKFQDQIFRVPVMKTWNRNVRNWFN